MAARSQGEEILSFDQDLRHAFSPLSQRLERGVEGIDKIIEILRLRISLEAEFAKGIDKIVATCDFASDETGTVREALDAIKADMKNEVRMRSEFVNSLNEDVYAPLIQTKDLYNARNIKYAQDTKANIRSLRQEQSKWIKMKAKYDKATKEAQEARSALLNAKSNQLSSSQQVVKLGQRVNTTMKAQQQLQEKFDSQKMEWNQEQIKFDDTMTTVLQGMESNEEARLNALGDALRKWAVFITNLTANRNYDVKSLAEIMSQINVKEDLQNFMRMTLGRNPIKNGENVTPHSVYKFQDSHSNGNNGNNGNNGSNDNGSQRRKSGLKSLSFDAKSRRRPSLSKSDLKKLASLNNSRNGSRRASDAQNTLNDNHGREDSLSKKSLSDMIRSNRLFRSSSSPDNNNNNNSNSSNYSIRTNQSQSPSNSNYASKNHSREASFVGVNGNPSLPENEAILPLPSEMLANKERLVEPPPQPRNSISKSSTSCDDPEIDTTLDLDNNEMKQTYDTSKHNNNNNKNNHSSSNVNNSIQHSKNDSFEQDNGNDSLLRVASIDKTIKERNHNVINSLNNNSNNSNKKKMKKPIKKSSRRNSTSSNSSNHAPFDPPKIQAPTPPTESVDVIDGIGVIETREITEATKARDSRESTPTLSGASSHASVNASGNDNESGIRFSNDLETNKNNFNNNVSLVRRKDQSPPASARNSLAHMSSLMRLDSKPKLNQPSIPEEKNDGDNQDNNK